MVFTLDLYQDSAPTKEHSLHPAVEFEMDRLVTEYILAFDDLGYS